MIIELPFLDKTFRTFFNSHRCVELTSNKKGRVSMSKKNFLYHLTHTTFLPPLTLFLSSSLTYSFFLLYPRSTTCRNSHRVWIFEYKYVKYFYLNDQPLYELTKKSTEHRTVALSKKYRMSLFYHLLRVLQEYHNIKEYQSGTL